MENFAELYRTFSTDKLLDILDHADEFHAPAVEAARQEIESRQLTTEQLTAVRTVQTKRSPDQQRLDAIESRIKVAGSVITDLLHPVQTKGASLEKYLQIISIFLGILGVYNLYDTVRLLALLIEFDRGFDASTAAEIVGTLLPVCAAGFLWYRRSIGWALAVIFFSHMASMAVINIYRIIDLTGNNPIGNTFFDEAIFPVEVVLTQIGALFIHGLTATMLLRKPVRERFGISSQDMASSIGTGVGLTLLNYALL